MTNTTNKTGAPGDHVLALNVPIQRYQQLFVAAVPPNLGINLIALMSDRATQKQEELLAHRMYSVGMTMRAMFEYDDFFAEFAPPNMIDYTIVASALRVPDDLLGQLLAANVKEVVLSTSFFDATQDPNEVEMIGCAIAGHLLGRMAEAVDSYDPANLQPLSLSSTAAAEYRKRVGNLYDSGRGIWCQDLIDFSGLMKVATRTLLDELPLVETLRKVMTSGETLPSRIIP